MEITVPLSILITLGVLAAGGYAWLIRLESKASGAKEMIEKHITDDNVHYNRGQLVEKLDGFVRRLDETDRKMEKFDTTLDTMKADFQITMGGVKRLTEDLQSAANSLRKEQGRPQ